MLPEDASATPIFCTTIKMRKTHLPSLPRFQPLFLSSLVAILHQLHVSVSAELLDVNPRLFGGTDNVTRGFYLHAVFWHFVGFSCPVEREHFLPSCARMHHCRQHTSCPSALWSVGLGCVRFVDRRVAFEEICCVHVCADPLCLCRSLCVGFHATCRVVTDILRSLSNRCSDLSHRERLDNFRSSYVSVQRYDCGEDFGAGHWTVSSGPVAFRRFRFPSTWIISISETLQGVFSSFCLPQ